MAKKRIKIRKPKTKKPCYFCKEKKEPSFRDIQVLKRYLTERNKIIPRSICGVCAKHQRELSKNIKYARHLALLPFTA
ncbi:MAG: 30S ribosomal protein S18 [Candidatus Levybacteria bacterium RIFCSPLOWO2_02_FULL_37_10]|nr:MAG: 30S ribosomal protein S18 [Candidatus Levybacteria bacterium RIFCSPHIGHO2_01_FULL_37_33]OGH16397.1 MAG: 30S ribosomal protein S18 [Candidatus Levybacteria bacterium RIFCSPHIGHO2_02_FULL_37_11]OGH30293.1 MAG: 30S ribosomal protein S18 [Candidatus Levybacteria bacterium RIFCSPHIGHO2_12_FULL_37_12]OGH43160.1 MAG: 30S ribosomal protein S18 [Candidatus Levybacteria bacterium RIFCSPLOWO2_02_FULL_37_10]